MNDIIKLMTDLRRLEADRAMKLDASHTLAVAAAEVDAKYHERLEEFVRENALRHIRKRCGRTLQYVANRSQVTITYISRLERRDMSRMSLKTIIRILNAYLNLEGERHADQGSVGISPQRSETDVTRSRS